MIFVAVLPPVVTVRKSRAKWDRSWLYVATVIACIAAFQWPSVLDNQELGDPDESQLIAAAITLAHDPLYYRSVDGATCGPLDEVPLAVLAALGVRIDYKTAHAMALGLTLVGLFATWLTLHRLFGDPISRIAILPLATWIAFNDFNQFLHYDTEQVPTALIAIAIVCMAYAWNPIGQLVQPRWLAGCGLAVGAVPFAKLQGGPIAFFVALVAGFLIVTTKSLSLSGRIRAVAFLIAGGILIPSVLLFAIWFFGQWGEFTRSYIVANLFYLSVRVFPWSEAPARLFYLVHVAPGLFPYLMPAVTLSVLLGIGMRPSLKIWSHRIALISLFLLLASGVTAIAPGRNVFHYLHFLFFPTALCVGCFLGAFWKGLDEAQVIIRNDRHWVAPVLSLSFVVCSIGPQVAWRARAPYPYAGLYSTGQNQLTVSEASQEILRHSGPADSLAIWGWVPRLWVETGMWQGTRDGNTIRQVESSGLQGTFQERYLHDLARNRPAVFVDSVGPGNFMADRASGAHERDALVSAYIAAEYRFDRDMSGMRIYVRKDLP